MSFLAPAWLLVAAAAAGAVIVLHFFARQRPRPAPLPTARFVPDIAARAPSLASRPSDALVMVLRVLALLAAGLALAGPQRRPQRRPVARVVAVVLSGSERSPGEALDSAAARSSQGDSLVRAPSLSAALVAAQRAAAALRGRADSLELVLVSAFAATDFDAATDSIRRLWPGRARLVRLPAAEAPPARRIELVAAADDPLRATVALLGPRRGDVTRLVRSRPTVADSAYARAGGVLVEWPRDPAGQWPAPATDTTGAVTAGSVVVVASFVRGAALADTAGANVALWVDGAPAAIEQPLGAGCLRRVAIPLPANGDLVLRRSVRDLVAVLAGDCGRAAAGPPATDEQLAVLRGSGALLPARLAPESRRLVSAASAWLLGVTALLLVVEMAARARRTAS